MTHCKNCLNQGHATPITCLCGILLKKDTCGTVRCTVLLLFNHSPMDDDQNQHVATEAEEKHKVEDVGQMRPQEVVAVPVTWTNRRVPIGGILIVKWCR